MPIKDPTIYPPYWKQFSLYIRTERSGGYCENCGVKNGLYKWRSFSLVYYADPTCFPSKDRFNEWRIAQNARRVVLTVAHLDHDGGPCTCQADTGRKCGRPDHVLALCQACHLALDRPKHIENARQTRITRNDTARGLFAGAHNN